MMGRFKATDQTGKEVWIHTKYLDQAVKDSIEIHGYKQEIIDLRNQLEAYELLEAARNRVET